MTAGPGPGRDLRATLGGWLFEHACAAKDAREFRCAFHLHTTRMRLCGWDRRGAAAVAKLVPQWALRVNV